MNDTGTPSTPPGIITAYANFIMNHPRLLVGVFLCMTVVFGYYLTKLEIDTSIEYLLMEDDPVFQHLDRAQKEFGISEFQAIFFEVPDAFDPSTLELVDRITRRLGEVAHVEKVISLTNVIEVNGDEEGLVIKSLIDHLPLTAEEAARIRERALRNHFLVDNLVSADGKVVAVNAKLTPQHEVKDPLYFVETMKEIRSALEEVAPGVKFRHAGVATVVESTMNAVMDDNRTFVGLTFILIVLTLYLVFRSMPGIYIPLSVVVLSLVWTVGFFSLMGRKLGPTTEVIPILIMIYCLSDTIHLLSRYSEENRSQPGKKDVLAVTLHHLLLACFLTSITTAVGFLSLATSKLRPVTELGLYTSAGIIFAYFIAVVIPSVFLLYRKKPWGAPRRERNRKFIQKVLVKIGGINERFPRALIVVMGVAVAGSIWGVFRIQVETTILHLFPQEGDLRQDYHFVDTRLSGVTLLQVVVRGEETIAKDPEVLAQVEQLERFIREIPYTGKVTSINHFLRRMNMVLHGEDREFFRIPSDRDQVAQLLELFSIFGKEEAIREYVNSDRTGLQVVARLNDCHSSIRQLEVVRAVESYLASNFDSEVQAEVTGYMAVYAATVDYLIRSLLMNIFISFFVISALMAVMVRSIRVGFLIMIPNIVPILITLGIMGWAGISLNMATVTLAAIALGIAVDSTIHFVARYRTELRKDADYTGAMYRTLSGTGQAIVFTAAVLSAGFGIFAFSNFLPNVYFGILMLITMISALAADLILLPVLLLIFRPRFPRALIDRLEKGPG